MKNVARIIGLILIGVLSVGCDDGPGGAGGAGADGGSGGSGGSGGTEDFAGFAVAPPPTGDEFKEKRTFDEKLVDKLADAVVPSTMAGAFVQLSRAYLSGRDPGNDMEASAFAILDAESQATKDAITRVIAGIDGLAAADSARLYGSSFVTAEASEVLSIADFSSAMDNELRTRLSLALFDDADPDACLNDERPGLARATTCPDIDADFDGFCNALCRINTSSLPQSIRTAGHIPFVPDGQLSSREVEQTCTVNASGGPPVCSTRMSPGCKGEGTAGGVCRAVPVVAQGGSITLEGFNFFNVDARVRLSNTMDVLENVEVPAHVCGDVSADAGAANDCDIKDKITFTVPSDTAVGTYRVSVVVPNDTGDPVLDRAEYSSKRGLPIIEVVPPDTAEFELLSEELLCIDETGADILGSDEVGLSVIVTRLSNDGTFDPLQDEEKFDFGNVDSGNRRRLDRRHFRGTLASQSIAVSIIGFEIDNREAFEQEITAFSDAFKAVMASNWGFYAATVGTVAGGIATLFGGPAVGAAVAAALTFAINSIVALWAPADLIIEDSAGIGFLNMVELTSPLFPNPPLMEYESSRGIDVTVEPCQDTDDRDRPECEASAKTPEQYRERREYNGGNRGSDYQITLRYRRVN